jgi:hypothetical protein
MCHARVSLVGRDLKEFECPSYASRLQIAANEGSLLTYLNTLLLGVAAYLFGVRGWWILLVIVVGFVPAEMGLLFLRHLLGVPPRLDLVPEDKSWNPLGTSIDQ